MSESKDLFHEAKSFYQAQNYERALKLYKNLTGLNPNNFSVWNNLGLCHAKLKDYKKAIVAFEKAIEVNEKKELIYSNLGKSYYLNGEFTKAIETYERGLKIFPNNASYLNGIGTACGELYNLEKAIQAFKLALDIDLESRIAWNNLCQAYGKKGVEFSPTEFKPENENSWHQLSIALLVSGLFEDSLYAINRALTINPHFHDAIMLRIKITLTIKENNHSNSSQSMNKTVSICGFEKDTKSQEESTLEERFKRVKEKLKRNIKQFDESSHSKPAKPEEPQKPRPKPQRPKKRPSDKENLVNINGKYHKIDEVNFVIDGANIARASISNNKRGKISKLYMLFEKLNSFGFKKFIILCDRSLYYSIDHQKEYKILIRNGRITETPGGAQADPFILKYAKENDSYIISNDLFREFRKFYDNEWLKDRLITFKFIRDKLYFDTIYTVTE